MWNCLKKQKVESWYQFWQCLWCLRAFLDFGDGVEEKGGDYFPDAIEHLLFSFLSLKLQIFNLMHFFLFCGVDAFLSHRVRCSGCSWNCFERHEFPWTLLHFYQQHCWNLHPASLIVLSKFATCDVSMPYVESSLSSDVALCNLWECSCICLCYEGISPYYKVPLFVV